MAVGSRFTDPETQAAIAAQGGAPEPTPAPAPEASATIEPAPAEGASKEPIQQTTEPEPEVNPEDGAGQETPAPATPADKEESASSTDMDKISKEQKDHVDKTLADAGFSNESLAKELVDNDGKMSEATVAALKEKFPADAVDKTIAQLEKDFADNRPALTEEAKAAAEAARAENAKIEEMNDYIIGKLAGGDLERGQANLKTLSTWAQANMDAKQLALINKKLASGDKDLVDEALTQAVDAWKKGQRHPMMEGNAAAAHGAKDAPAFEPLSKDQFIQAMASKKYQEDPEYAAKIDARRRKTMETEGLVTPEYSSLRPPI